MTGLMGQIQAYADGWTKDATGWRYVYEDGTWATSDWISYNGNWYFVNQDGYRMENTFAPDGRYLDATGKLVKNSGIDRDYMREASADETVIVYNKYSHILELWSHGQFLFRCSGVSGREDGDKEVEGDAKTPLGEFFIGSKVEKDMYYKGMGLSYPNLEDAQRGLDQKLITKAQYNNIKKAIEQKRLPNWYTKLGGAIMIHGEKNSSDGSSGCIGVDNKDMDVLWNYAKMGTKVIIMDTGIQTSGVTEYDGEQGS